MQSFVKSTCTLCDTTVSLLFELQNLKNTLIFGLPLRLILSRFTQNDKSSDAVVILSFLNEQTFQISLVTDSREIWCVSAS